jgi:EAL domain-containing protein (putative c-di-GMP-specific phosphodiesterase class I)
LALTAARQSSTRTATYTAAMSTRARRRLRLHGLLQGAIGRGELSLVYQPQIDLTTSRMVAVEALCRWQHPSLHAISPAEFIPLAEDTGLATELGGWVLREACQQAARWSHELPEPLRVSVNVSSHQLMDPAVTDTLVSALRTTGLSPWLLTLEITESVLIRDPVAVHGRLDELRSLGVQTAVDDFGTGYSGLGALTRLPLDELKIDRSFVAGLPDQASLTVTRSIVGLGRALGLRIVAEGIETVEQRQALVGLDCTLGQGFLFAPPMPPDAIADWGSRRLRVASEPA